MWVCVFVWGWSVLQPAVLFYEPHIIAHVICVVVKVLLSGDGAGWLEMGVERSRVLFNRPNGKR